MALKKLTARWPQILSAPTNQKVGLGGADARAADELASFRQRRTRGRAARDPSATMSLAARIRPT